MNNLNRIMFSSLTKLKFRKTSLNYCTKIENKFDLDPRIVQRTFKTTETDPSKHNFNHEGLYYCLPNDIKNKVFVVYNWNKRQKFMFESYGEISFMIRKPALKIIDDINNSTDNNLKKYILYGYPGVGRNSILSHLIHYAYKKNFVIIHLYDVFSLSRYPIEYTHSDTKKERIDTPIESTMLLQNFKAQNIHLIKNLKTSQKYEWSLKEFTEKNQPLIHIIEHGLNRINHASDCYAALLKEIKIAANFGLIKIMVIVNKINLLFWPTNIRKLDRSFCYVDDVTVLRAIKKLLNKDWKNGYIVGTTDGKSKDKFEEHYSKLPIIDPVVLLKPEGVEKLQPFKQIEVECFNENEFLNCLAYMNSINFITHPKVLTKKGIDELQFITNGNAFDLIQELRWL